MRTFMNLIVWAFFLVNVDAMTKITLTERLIEERVNAQPLKSLENVI